jgi:hypothetical protein
MLLDQILELAIPNKERSISDRALLGSQRIRYSKEYLVVILDNVK